MQNTPHHRTSRLVFFSEDRLAGYQAGPPPMEVEGSEPQEKYRESLREVLRGFSPEQLKELQRRMSATDEEEQTPFLKHIQELVDQPSVERQIEQLQLMRENLRQKSKESAQFQRDMLRIDQEILEEASISTEEEEGVGLFSGPSEQVPGQGAVEEEPVEEKLEKTLGEHVNRFAVGVTDTLLKKKWTIGWSEEKKRNVGLLITAGGVALVGLAVWLFAKAKKGTKILVAASAAVAAGIGYYYWDKIAPLFGLKKAGEKIGDAMKQAKDKVGDATKKVKDTVRDGVKKSVEKEKETHEIVYSLTAPAVLRLYGDQAEKHDVLIFDHSTQEILRDTMVLLGRGKEGKNVTVGKLLTTDSAALVQKLYGEEDPHADQDDRQLRENRQRICAFIIEVIQMNEVKLRAEHKILTQAKDSDWNLPENFEALSFDDAYHLIGGKPFRAVTAFAASAYEILTSPTSYKAVIKRVIDESYEQATEITMNEFVRLLHLVPEGDRKDIRPKVLSEVVTPMRNLVREAEGKFVDHPILNPQEEALMKKVVEEILGYVPIEDGSLLHRACEGDQRIIKAVEVLWTHVRLDDGLQVFYMHEKESVIALRMKVLHLLHMYASGEEFAYAAGELGYNAVSSATMEAVNLARGNSELSPEQQRFVRMLWREISHGTDKAAKEALGLLETTPGKAAVVVGGVGVAIGGVAYANYRMLWSPLELFSDGEKGVKAIMKRYGVTSDVAKQIQGDIVSKAIGNRSPHRAIHRRLLAGNLRANINTARQAWNDIDDLVKSTKPTTAKSAPPKSTSTKPSKTAAPKATPKPITKPSIASSSAKAAEKAKDISKVIDDISRARQAGDDDALRGLLKNPLLKEAAKQSDEVAQVAKAARWAKRVKYGSLGLSALINIWLLRNQQILIDSEKKPEIKKILEQERTALITEAIGSEVAIVLGVKSLGAAAGGMASLGAAGIVLAPIIGATVYTSVVRNSMKEWAKTSEDWISSDSTTLLQEIRSRTAEGANGMSIGHRTAHGEGTIQFAWRWITTYGEKYRKFGEEQARKVERVNWGLRYELNAAYFLKNSRLSLRKGESAQDHVQAQMKFMEVESQKKFDATITSSFENADDYAELVALRKEQGDVIVYKLPDGTKKQLDLRILDQLRKPGEMYKVKQLLHQYRSEYKVHTSLMEWAQLSAQAESQGGKARKNVHKYIKMKILNQLRHQFYKTEMQIQEVDAPAFQKNVVRMHIREQVNKAVDTLAADAYEQKLTPQKFMKRFEDIQADASVPYDVMQLAARVSSPLKVSVRGRARSYPRARARKRVEKSMGHAVEDTLLHLAP